MSNAAPAQTSTQPGSAPDAIVPANKLFDASGQVTIVIRSGGDKKCIVRYPTDAEWANRARKQKIVRKSLGRGKSMPIPQRNEGEDLKLFDLIRQANGDDLEFDAAEASAVVGLLDNARVTDVERNADGYRILLSASGPGTAGPRVRSYSTVHVLRCPLISQTLAHGRDSVVRMDDDKLQVLRIALEPSADLYNQLVKPELTTGYVPGSPVPITHKFAIIYELISFVEREMSEDDDDESVEALGASGE